MRTFVPDAGDELEDQYAERVDVGGCGREFAVDALRGDGIGCAEVGRQGRGGKRYLRAGFGIEDARDAEIGEDGGSVAVEQDVLRLEVRMHDAFRVAVGERRSDLAVDAEDGFRIQRLGGDAFRERHAVADEVHYQVGASVVEDPVFDGAYDVRMVERFGKPGFGEETFGEGFPVGAGDDVEKLRGTDRAAGRMDDLEDRAHSAASDFADDGVFAYSFHGVNYTIIRRCSFGVISLSRVVFPFVYDNGQDGAPRERRKSACGFSFPCGIIRDDGPRGEIRETRKSLLRVGKLALE